ncbi:dTDP-4-dehydrorhamnose reductase [Alkaliphilus serpentinus]|uniref:dTDP-4-dehydrorhamnose reductase n=1 Tax=Alkaliphilus serpentinus TaxID=1482731 RepID=A0A833MCT9_9FIRM|nr:dTDP-4-dehydrorhamnose reductase [Alkaliphilus serpentinus]KAB3526634.1 dTDP-4-dehydrorhamnose reductase [Alkaliphilus serpentinus]
MTKALVVGYSGQLGHELIKVLKLDDLFKKSIEELIMTDSSMLDITCKNLVLKYILKIQPDIIINCAAYTKVDQAEDDYEKAFQVNSLGPRNLAIAAEAIGAKLIHISTDYVFDGKGVLVNGEKVPYREYDTTNPINVYGKTKLLGEEYVREFCSKYFIIRTSWLYGEKGNNFVKTIIGAAKDKGKLQVVDDQLGNPTYAGDLAERILKLALTDEYGLYHCTGKGICSWYDFAKKIIEYTEIPCEIEAVTSDNYKRKAQRPSYSCLDNMMLRSTIGDDMREWQDALYDFIKNRLML